MKNIINLKFLLFSICYLLLTGFSVQPVLAFETQEFHTSLAKEIINFYSSSYPNLSQELKQYEPAILLGVEDEGHFPNYLAHSYNPVDVSKNRSDIKVIKDRVLGVGNSDKKFPEFVASILGSQSEKTHSWNDIIKHYNVGEKETAYYGLGRMFHLLIDTSIADRTRDESNASMYIEGISPYEDFLASLTSDKFNLAEQLLKEKALSVSTTKIEKLFDDLGNYSSNNFYSEGTIFSVKDKNIVPLLSGKESNTGLVFSYNKTCPKCETYHLVRYNIDLASGYLRPTLATPNIYGNKVVEDYWKQLSRQTILTGSGVINLFNSQITGIDKNNPELSFLGEISGAFRFFHKFFHSSINSLGNLFSVSSFATIGLYNNGDSIDSGKYFSNLTTSDQYLKNIFNSKNFQISAGDENSSVNDRKIGGGRKELEDQNELLRKSLSLEVLLPGSIAKAISETKAVTPLLLISGEGYRFGSGYGTGGGGGGSGGSGGGGGGGGGGTTQTLTVSKTGTGTGTITGTGINCGLDCTENYSTGTSVGLT
ncbi:hypothetical protein HY061_03125, partial [Candidatus Azambacteria bacterium]|nr:hypothetical protein [Candidatus Azambacteria bacterium]